MVIMIKEKAVLNYRRINITLPEKTFRLLERVGKKGNRSWLIDQAVQHYVETVGRAKLRARLKTGAIKRAEQSRQLAADWFALEEEVWTKTGK